MREPERIDRILKQIETIWKAYPDMRLGQLLENYGYGCHKDKCIFNVEDDILEENLSQEVKSINDE